MPLLPLDVPLLAGAALGWSLSAPPGPGNALIAQDAARRGWTAGVATGMGAIAADVLMFLLMWVGVLRLLALVPGSLVVVGAVGSVVMLKFALDAYRAARHPATVDASARGGFGKTFLAIVSSPFNHIWWLTAGAAVFANLGAGLVVGFFGSLVLWVMFWSGLATAGAARVKRFAEWIGYASAVVLVAFALVIGAFTLHEALALSRA